VLGIERAPEHPNFVMRQDTIARRLSRHGLQSRGRIGINPVAIEREIEHLLHQRQDPVRHDRGALFS